MENKKEVLSKAYKEGKIIQSNNSGEWINFEPQNQVDSPNFDYKSIDNWRIKPEEETLEKAISTLISGYDERGRGIAKMFAQIGAEWQAERMYTEEQLCYFAGYVAGKKHINSGLSISEILEEFKKSKKHD